MKLGFVALSGFAWLRLVSSACCRSNQCLKAVGFVEDGVADCSSLLAVTVTNAASTFTETTTIVPIEYRTVVDTAIITSIETTTASTETLLFTEVVTVTPETETITVTVPSTVTLTTTSWVTTTEILRKRGDTLSLPGSTEPTVAHALPVYASESCPSWDRYTSACKCAGVTPTTVTVEAPVETVTEEVTSAIVSPLLTTILTTTTDVTSVIETVSDTQTETTLVTDMTVTIQTALTSTTSTIVRTVRLIVW